MTRDQIASMISGIGLPFAYDHFEDADAPGNPPFICFLYPNRDDFVADDTNYVPITQLVIELYTDEVDFDLEDRVEAAISAADMVYLKDQTYIDTERMYQTTYTMEVCLNA